MNNIKCSNLDQVTTLDTSGLRCPMPIMQTKLKISKLTYGDKLLVIATDPSFTIDCNVFLRQSGHLLLNSWLEGGKKYFYIQHNRRSEAT